jgi:hypothetical protein
MAGAASTMREGLVGTAMLTTIWGRRVGSFSTLVPLRRCEKTAVRAVYWTLAQFFHSPRLVWEMTNESTKFTWVSMIRCNHALESVYLVSDGLWRLLLFLFLQSDSNSTLFLRWMKWSFEVQDHGLFTIQRWNAIVSIRWLQGQCIHDLRGGHFDISW